MDALTSLKEELKKQKEIIEKMDGKVIVANTNPSPSEITSGIQSIPSVDLSGSTATESDVKYGKTFYSGNAIIKTGTATIDTDSLDALFMAPYETNVFENEIYYAVPSFATDIKKYHFYGNLHSVTFSFNENVEIICEYAFYKTPDFKFERFDEMTKLTTIEHHAFTYSGAEGVTMDNLPSSIRTIGDYAFFHATHSNMDIKFPSALTALGAYSYVSSERKLQNSLDVTNLSKIKTFPAHAFKNNAFNCDLIVPSTMTAIGGYANYGGCFKNIYFNSNLTSLSGYSFGAITTDPISNFYLRTVNFSQETPPTTVGSNVFALQNMDNGFKIYVPDNSVEEYKAVTNFVKYADYIFPMSQKE